MVRILLNDGLDQDVIDLLKKDYDVVDKHYDHNELKSEIKNYDVLVVRSKTTVDKSIIDASLESSKLKLIIRAGVGLDNIDLEYANKNNIIVKNTPKASTQVVAELTISFMLALSRNITVANESMKKMEWTKSSLKGSELYLKTLGIIGFGRIGRKVAKLATVFNMNVIYYDLFTIESEFDQVTLHELFKRSDYISLHAPAQEEPFINYETLNKFKKGVKIINTSRGSAINEDALIKGIKEDIISGAALDVYQKEPNVNAELTKLKQVIMTPHIGASTSEATKRIGHEVYQTVKSFYDVKKKTKRLNVGMPVLMEYQTIEENIVLASQLNLDFIELNMNFLYCYPSQELRQKLVSAKEKYGLSFTFHYYDNVDISSPNNNYMEYLNKDMEFIGKTLNGLINKVVLHIEPGSFMTIFSEKHYVYKYDKEYVSRTLKNIKLLEKTLNDYNIRIVLENVPIFPYMENLYKTLNENGVAFTWDVGHDVMYEHYLFSSFRKKFNLNIKHMHLHNVFNRSDHHRLTLGKLNIKEYIKYAMNNDISVVIEVKDRENLEESVNYLYDYLDGIQDQVVEDNIWTP